MFVSHVTFRKGSRFKVVTGLRLLVAACLAVLLVVAPLSACVLAFAARSAQPGQKLTTGPGFTVVQQVSKPAPLHSKGSDVDSFIIRMLNGVATCQEATREELPLTLPRLEDRGVPISRLLPLSAVTQGSQNSLTGLTINLIALSQLQTDPDSATVIAAFQRAAAVWTARIKSPVSISVNIDYGVNLPGPSPSPSPFPAGVLGSTSTRRVEIDYPGARANLIASSSNSTEAGLYSLLPTTFVPSDIGNGGVISVARSLARPLGIPVSSPQDENVATISFNKNIPFDFNPDDGIGFGKTDFVAVATHEIGHALGFVSEAGRENTSPVSVWDMFRFRPGTTVSTFTTAQRIVSIGGEQAYFTGQTFSIAGVPTAELRLSTGGSAPNPGDGDGHQSSHWKDDNNVSSNYIGIMDPTISRGVHEEATENDFSSLETFGWNLMNSVAPPPPPPPPAPPGNDNFVNAQVIGGCAGSMTGTNVGATKEAGEPNHSPDEGGGSRSAWYQWQSPANVSVTVTTAGSRFDTVLAVYTGNAVGSLTPIVKNDDVGAGDLTSSITFTASAGTIYRIAVDGYNNDDSGGDIGPVTLNWSANCVPPTNTLDQPLFFVRQHYVDFLNREPDASGLGFWFNEITSCGADAQCIEVKRINVSAAFFLSIEFQQTGYLVYRMYKVAYGNLGPDAPVPVKLSDFSPDTQLIGHDVQVGIGDWQTRLENNKVAFTQAFVQRPAFLAAFPSGMAAGAFVDKLDLNAGSVLSSSEKANLVGVLNGDADNPVKRASVLRSVAENQNLSNAEFNKAFVLMQYFGYLRRNPNDAPDTNFSGWQFWLDKLNQFNGNFVNAEMVKAFLSSSEYRNRFGT